MSKISLTNTGIHANKDELSWNPGSLEKIALHAAIGGIMAKLGENAFKTGAMPNAFNEALINEIGKIGDLHCISRQTIL